MTRISWMPLIIAVAIINLLTLPAPATAQQLGDFKTASGDLVVFEDPYGNGATNPTEGGTAQVQVLVTPLRQTIVLLQVRGLTPSRTFGAHVHVASVAQGQGSDHYQNVAGIASQNNEIWLDFTTDRSGNAISVAWRPWTIRPDGANSIIIHDHATDAAGVAGPKLAGIDVPF